MNDFKDVCMTFKQALRTSPLKQMWPWIFAALPAIVLLEAQAVARVGHHSLLFLELPFRLPLLLAPFAIVILPLVALRRSLRPTALAWWVAAAIALASAIGGLCIGKHIRHRGFERLAARSAPLVAAILSYDARHGRPPPSLEALVPEHLPAVPKTGIMAYPRYEYHAGDEAKRYDGNPWVLVVDTPSGGVNFDTFTYFPLQNYPQTGYGGSLERIRDWAYVHE